MTGNGDGDVGALDVLQRLGRSRAPQATGERCEMCGAQISAAHSHVVNLEARSLLCACRACMLLFTSSGSGGGKFRAVPERYLSVPAFAMSHGEWDALQIPVSVAFFFFNSSMGRVAAFYPSPAGAMESLLPLDTWERVVEANPVARTLEPDVEALLIRAGRDAPECFVVPIDACYELVGLLRSRWRGFDGGQEAHDALDGFFTGLHERSREVTPEGES